MREEKARVKALYGHDRVVLIPPILYQDGTSLDKNDKAHAKDIMVSLGNFSCDLLAKDCSKRLLGFFPNVDDVVKGVSVKSEYVDAWRHLVEHAVVKHVVAQIRVTSSCTCCVRREPFTKPLFPPGVYSSWCLQEIYEKGGIKWRNPFSGEVWNLVPVVPFLVADHPECCLQKWLKGKWNSFMPCHLCEASKTQCSECKLDPRVPYRAQHTYVRRVKRWYDALHGAERDGKPAASAEDKKRAETQMMLYSAKVWSDENPWKDMPWGANGGKSAQTT